MKNQLFFSIVIPAHNEEEYIENTLKSITAINYPQDLFEVVVIENGSTDKTFEKASSFSVGNIRVISSKEKGVSKARNRGVIEINKNSDWVIFLDADTFIKSNFLKDLHNFLLKNQAKNYVIGTTSFKPFPDSFKARFWFAIYDLGHRIYKVSNPPHIIKRSLLYKVKYDEQMAKAEDLKFVRDARKFGRFFLFSTDTILSSTRRFEKVGWFKLFFLWTTEAVSPTLRKKNPDYEVIR